MGGARLTEHRLKGNPEGTSGGISYVFPLCFIVLLKQLRRLYTSGFIFQVPPVYNYSTCCTNRVLTRSVHQVRVYAFGIPTTRRRLPFVSAVASLCSSAVASLFSSAVASLCSSAVASLCSSAVVARAPLVIYPLKTRHHD